MNRYLFLMGLIATPFVMKSVSNHLVHNSYEKTGDTELFSYSHGVYSYNVLETCEASSSLTITSNDARPSVDFLVDQDNNGYVDEIHQTRPGFQGSTSYRTLVRSKDYVNEFETFNKADMNLSNAKMELYVHKK